MQLFLSRNVAENYTYTLTKKINNNLIVKLQKLGKLIMFCLKMSIGFH